MATFESPVCMILRCFWNLELTWIKLKLTWICLYSGPTHILGQLNRTPQIAIHLCPPLASITAASPSILWVVKRREEEIWRERSAQLENWRVGEEEQKVTHHRVREQHVACPLRCWEVLGPADTHHQFHEQFPQDSFISTVFLVQTISSSKFHLPLFSTQSFYQSVPEFWWEKGEIRNFTFVASFHIKESFLRKKGNR